MEIQEFIEKFSEQFFDTDPTLFKPETEFRQFEEWSSMTGLCILTMIKDEYGFFMNPNEFKFCNTVEEVYKVVMSHVQSV